MNQFEYRVSMIVPVYNVEKFLRGCLDSLVNQTIAEGEMEVLMIDDGSPDNSIEIMQEYAAKYPYMKIFRKQNEGLSMTRNYGIERAKGKYLMYLDSDDTLTPETVKSVADFFDKHYDEVDLVGYNEIPVINGVADETRQHYRFRQLKESGVYDLNLFENAFISQTRINVAVKNEPGNNVLFDFDRTFRHEDQKYCIQVLQRKMKYGFCNKGTYLYVHQAESIVRTFFYAYYMFEPTMRFWEEIFGGYEDKVPQYIQALYMNDLEWKTKQDILLPYHYEPEEFEKAKGRLLALLNRVDDAVILRHPAIDVFHRHFFISLKTNKKIEKVSGPEDIVITNQGHVVLSLKRIEIHLRQFKAKKGELRVMAFIKSPLFNYLDKPELYMVKNRDYGHPEKITLRESSFNYYNAKIVTNHFWLFNLKINTTKVRSFEFLVKVGDQMYRANYSFAPETPFDHMGKLYTHYRDGMAYAYEAGVFRIYKPEKKELTEEALKKRRRFMSEPKYWAARQVALTAPKKKQPIWLYHDCKGVGRDNGYFQFDHDFDKHDGIIRYYVINEDNFNEIKNTFPAKQRSHLVKFGSRKHQILYLQADKVVTAFIEQYNYWPFYNELFRRFKDISNQPDLVYLQHGVLHAHLPWHYAMDRIIVDKEVISTTFEEQNLTENYCFTKDRLIPCGMPRYDFIDADEESVNRILFAPSWRKFLIGQENNKWVTTEGKFLASKFFEETSRFLNSPRLHELLEKYDMYLDYKMHPIFERYKHLYKIDNDRVTMAEKKIKETTYKVFMTDFSSFVFDFLYLKRPVINFMPDYELFRAGMNDYRELDMPLEDGYGDFVETADDAVEALARVLENGCVPEEKYAKKMEGLFFHKDNQQRDRLYEALMAD